MKTRHAVLLMLLLMLFANAATAATVIVRGFSSCGQWMQEQRVAGTPETGSRFWLIGYLSGLAASTRKDILKGTDNASIYLWMDNYCTANPLKDVADGGDALFVELEKKIRRQ